MRAPAGSREGPSPLSVSRERHVHRRAACLRTQAQAWRSYVPPAARASQSRTTEETGQVAAARRAGATTPRRSQRFAALPAFANAAGRPSSTPRRSRCTTRSPSSRASTASRRGTRCAKKSRRARCRSTPRSTSSSAARPAARRAAPQRLLALHPGIASATLQTALVLGDAAAVEARLARSSGARDRRRAGRSNWEPLLYACHTCMHRTTGASTVWSRSRGGCCALGANPNAEYHWNWHPELPRTALWARALRDPASAARRGAARGRRQSDGRRLDAHRRRRRQSRRARAAPPLRRRTSNGIPGGVPPLVYMMTWATNPAGPRWLLEHGADANLAWGDDGEAPLHVAARRWDVAMVEAARARTAPIRARTPRRRPHAAHARRAARQSRHRRRGCSRTAPTTSSRRSNGSSPRCARGDRAGAEAMLARTAGAPQPSCAPSTTSCSIARPRAATRRCSRRCSRAGSIRTRTDKDNVTPLHRAAMGGHPDAVRVLLAHGAPRQRARRHVLGDAARLGRRRPQQRAAAAPITSPSRGC